MGTLGAVYGISFVAGSLASMGSAYMASKIYPIEETTVGEETHLVEDVIPKENPFVGDIQPEQENPFVEPDLTPWWKRGMRGGASIRDLQTAFGMITQMNKSIADAKALPASASAADKTKSWNTVNSNILQFIAFAKSKLNRGILADQAKNTEEAARRARSRNDPTVRAKDAAAKTARDALVSDILDEHSANVPTAAPAPAPAPASAPAPVAAPKKIVIIGAGPVGLFAAVKLLDIDPKVKVVILESLSQNNFTSREQELFIENKIFDKFPHTVKEELKASPNACRIFRPAKALQNYCFNDLDNNDQTGYSIKINTLQSKLVDFCKTNKYRFEIKFGAKAILNGDVINYTDNYGNIQNISFTNLIVTSGDVTKVIPYNLFKSLPVPEIPATYGMAISMKIDEIKLPAVITNKVDEATIENYKNAKLQHRFRFFRQQKNDIYLGINLSRDEYEQFMIGLPGNPATGVRPGTNPDEISYTIENNIFDLAVKTVAAYLNVSEDSLVADITIPAKGLTVFPINLRYTRPGHIELSNKSHIYIAGDAAMETHFFTGFGVNFGLESAEKVVDAINTPGKLKDYDTFLEVSKNTMITKTKAILLDFTRQCDAAKINSLKASQPFLARFQDKDICLMNTEKDVASITDLIKTWIETNQPITKSKVETFLTTNNLSPGKFIDQYAIMLENRTLMDGKPIQPLSFDLIEVFVTNPDPKTMVGGRQLGGSMVDFAIYDIVSGIEEASSFKRLLNVDKSQLKPAPYNPDEKSSNEMENQERKLKRDAEIDEDHARVRRLAVARKLAGENQKIIREAEEKQRRKDAEPERLRLEEQSKYKRLRAAATAARAAATKARSESDRDRDNVFLVDRAIELKRVADDAEREADEAEERIDPDGVERRRMEKEAAEQRRLAEVQAEEERRQQADEAKQQRLDDENALRIFQEQAREERPNPFGNQQQGQPGNENPFSNQQQGQPGNENPFSNQSAAGLANPYSYSGGAMSTPLRRIIENGPFKSDNTSAIDYDTLIKLKNIIIAFNGFIDFPTNKGEYDFVLNQINKERAAKVLTVTSWLRSVPNKTKITEKDIAEIVPGSLSFKQFVDILSEMVTVENKKQTIKLDKDIFKKATDVVPPSYVLDTTIKFLTDQLSDNIEIKHIITYFEKGGSLYTFFHFKNVMRLLYDYRFGDISYDKIIINLSKIVEWLKTTKVNKITNVNIVAFKTNNPTVSMDVLVDTLHYLIKQKVTINNKVIRVGDFSAIETLDPDNVDSNTKVISWLIDPKRATLPKPTETQLAAFKVVNAGSNPTDGGIKMATLFVGPFQLSDELTKGSDGTTPEVNENIKTFGLLQEIQKTIDKRKTAKKEYAKAEEEYKTGIRKKESTEFIEGTESAQYRKMIEETNKKDAKIKELNEAIAEAKKEASSDKNKKDNEKRFTERLAEAIKQKEYRSLEALLKERNADLAKEYEQSKKDNGNKGGELKPPEAIKSEWGNLIGKIRGMNGDHSKLILATVEFRKTHTDEQVKPEYKSIDAMFNALWAKFGKKKGGYHETLRNHLRSRRHTYRRL